MTTKTQAEGPKKWTYTELRRYEGPIFAENVSHTVITCNDEVDGKTVKVRLEPAGQAGSIDEIPKLAFSVRGFRNLVDDGKIRLALNEDLDEVVEVRTFSKVAEVPSVAAGPKDQKCLECGDKAVQTTRQVNDGHAPLCRKHVGESKKYIPTLVDASKKGDGLGIWEFTKSTDIIMDPVVRTSR